MKLLILLVLTISIAFHACDFSSETAEDTKPEIHVEINEEPVPDHDIFGIDERLESSTHIIRRNESLSTILRNYGLSHRQISELANAAGDVFNVRRIRAGRPLHLYKQSNENQEEAQTVHIVYEENKTEYVKFDIADSITVSRGAKEVTVQKRIVSGEIRSSLYQTMRQIGAETELTYRLADVFAWQVDFYRIQEGDRFKILYEEHVLEDEVIETGRIKAAVFTHRNQDHYAFHYKQNGLDEYFDENGKSLRRQFMAAPLNYTRISSRFTNNRYHPVLQRNMPHHGTDYAAPVGTPIRAVGDGVVTVARYGRNNGNYVRIRHNSVYETGYLHMSRFAQDINAGTEVEQGQIIGYVGATGLATGPHLCFRFWQNGEPVNPQRIDLPPAEPIKSKHLMAYTDRKIDLLGELDLDPDSIINRPVTIAKNIGYNGVLSQIKREETTTEL